MILSWCPFLKWDFSCRKTRENCAFEVQTCLRFLNDEGKKNCFILTFFFPFKGYFRDTVKTDEAIDSKGWLHTGDIASLSPDGQVFLVSSFEYRSTVVTSF